MTTWREGVEHWRVWARKDNSHYMSPHDADCIEAFYKALARHGGGGGSFDDEMPAELVKQVFE
jgi:hypothetical protein